MAPASLSGHCLRRPAIAALLLLLASAYAPRGRADSPLTLSTTRRRPPAATTMFYSFDLVREYPHDPDAFTEVSTTCIVVCLVLYCTITTITSFDLLPIVPAPILSSLQKCCGIIHLLSRASCTEEMTLFSSPRAFTTGYLLLFVCVCVCIWIIPSLLLFTLIYDCPYMYSSKQAGDRLSFFRNQNLITNFKCLYFCFSNSPRSERFTFKLEK
uniref:Uncharacterized protein n=1 Tax=Arundo donax TaxID=35708 RepID=A0A0A9EJZ0_ARUDO